MLDTQILGWERAYARSHPKIWPPVTAKPGEPDISVPPRRINEIVLGKRSITPDTALRLSLYFGLSERFWMNMQTRYDIEVEKDRLQNRLKREVRVYPSTH